MAFGDITVFDKTVKWFFDGTHDCDTHSFKCAILNNTTPPTAADAAPALSAYTEIGTAGSYVAGGEAVTVTLTELGGGSLKIDITVDPTWLKNAANDTDAYWGLVYNDTDAGKVAVLFVDLDGPVDLTKGDLTITWSDSGVITINKV